MATLSKPSSEPALTGRPTGSTLSPCLLLSVEAVIAWKWLLCCYFFLKNNCSHSESCNEPRALGSPDPGQNDTFISEDQLPLRFPGAAWPSNSQSSEVLKSKCLALCRGNTIRGRLQAWPWGPIFSEDSTQLGWCHALKCFCRNLTPK